jgi:surface antigen Omp85-like protein
MQNAALIVRLGIATLTLACVCGQAWPAAAQQPRSTPSEALPIPDTASEPEGFLVEPTFVTRAAIFADRNFGNGDRTNGYYTDFWNMVPGAGWIAGGPGYRHWYAKDRLFIDGSAAISWRGYKTAQARLELPRLAKSRLALGSQFRWQDYTQVTFYGTGPDTLRSTESEYRLRSTNIAGYVSFRPIEPIAIDAEIGVLNPSILPRAGTFKRDLPDTSVVFPRDPVYAFNEQPTFVHSEAAIAADTRDFPGHTLRGGLYRAAISRYSDRDSGVFSFNRYELEAAHFVPLAASRVVIALHGWLVSSDPGNGQTVPFYLQPSVGGHNSLRGYDDYRFHDRNMMLFSAEARIAAMTHVDGAFFFDAGNVAARVGDLNFDKRSWGAGLRLHSRRQTYARLDLARGDEGWRLMFRLTDPLHLTRVTHRTAAAPFVP